jgi:poly-gamma-glutamate capsule biosynthesis protein CapA/YwtB (metallophosphatase superfamily)
VTTRRRYAMVALFSIGVFAGATWMLATFSRREAPAPLRGVGALTVAATGDAVIVEPLTNEQLAAASSIATLLGSADVAITNLEAILFDPTVQSETLHTGKLLVATLAAADTLRALGVNVVSRANNHAADYGPEGLQNTARLLETAGLRHVGAGEHLATARQPLVVGDRPRRVAIVAVTASSSPEARATATRGEIQGRAGVNPLRYTARIVADPQTFETLKTTATELKADAGEQTPDHFTFLGATITKGERTEVRFVLDEQDLAEIVSAVAALRTTSDAIVVSVHSHEPSNHSDTPAEFLQHFARAVIDAGAALVVGHGPHRIRGVERYGRGVILYSLGNFIFQHSALDPRRVDIFDAGADMYRVALGAWSPGDAPLVNFDEPIWREGLIAQATFVAGDVVSVRLHAVQISNPRERGAPRLAETGEAARILERVRALSAVFGTTVTVEDGTGEVAVRSPTP